jgi:hypothetical protein
MMGQLSATELAERMLSHLPFSSRKKVALIVVLATSNLPEFENLDDEPTLAKVNAALDILVQRSDVQAFGNIENWRHSEIFRVLDFRRLDARVARRLLDAIDLFSEPINNLEGILRGIDDNDLRRHFLRILGEVMAQLDSKIGYEARRTLRLTE